MADGYYRIDLHSHAGRCFLAGLPAGHSAVAAMGAAAIADAIRAARAAGMTALALARSGAGLAGVVSIHGSLATRAPARRFRHRDHPAR